MAPERHIPDWDRDLRMAPAADRMGFEALVPLSRWCGFDGPTDFNGICFETATWAAGLRAGTRNPAVMATQHVPTNHPIVAAKGAVTVDHISDSRYGINIVCGWFTPGMEMFGGRMMEHHLRYAYAQEWVDVVKMFWSRDDYSDVEGKFFNIKKGFAQPKPIHKPFPPPMNGGVSPRVQRETHKEADEFLSYYTERYGDDEATVIILGTLGVETGIFTPEEQQRSKFHFKAGWGGYPLVGTPETIVDTIQTLSDIGLDGISLTWVDDTDDIARWEKGVMPLLEQSGLRRGFAKAA